MCSIQDLLSLAKKQTRLSFVEWPFICAFSYCNNYETNSDKNQNLNSSSGIVIRPLPYVEFIGSWSPPHRMDSVHYTTVLKALIFSSSSYTSSSKISQFHEWFCVAMLTEQALASKKMIFLKKYLMKSAKNKFLDLLNFHNFSGSLTISPFPHARTLQKLNEINHKG